MHEFEAFKSPQDLSYYSVLGYRRTDEEIDRVPVLFLLRLGKQNNRRKELKLFKLIH